MLHSATGTGAGRDLLRQQLLPAHGEEDDSELDHQHSAHPEDNVVPDAVVLSSTPISAWGVMGSFLGRFTRSSSSCTSSSGNSDQQPCTLISVDRLQQQQQGVNGSSEYAAPIVGYEVMEERARFTVFKVQVQHQSTGRQWFIFRRYTDFARLNRKLRTDYRGLRFALPAKRWFGDNFDPIFLEDRLYGLQAFVDNIIAHTDISKCPPVREFFCLDDPPGPDDSLEESKALCENLEDAVIRLQELVRQRDREVTALKSEVSMLKSQQQALLKSLKLQSRLASVACAQLQDEQQVKMDSSQSQQFLAHMHKVNQFNLSLAKTIDRSMKTGSLSDLGSRLSLSKVEEESSSLMATASSIFEKAASMDDICSRSTGDGSTGSRERLPPLGQVSQEPNPERTVPANDVNNVESTVMPTFDEKRTVFNGNDQPEVNLSFSESCSPAPFTRDLKMSTVSFKKLLENNPDLSDSSVLHKLPPVVTLSGITVAST